MADKKISALDAATTPLVGTEVLPIVQSGITKKVSVDNLTAGKAISVAGLTDTTLTASKVVFTDGSKNLSSSGTVAIDQGGTGQTTQQAALNAIAGATTNKQYLRGNGTNVSMSALDLTDDPTPELGGDLSTAYSMNLTKSVAGLYEAINISNPSAVSNGRGSVIHLNGAKTAGIRSYFNGSSEDTEITSASVIRMTANTEIGYSFAGLNLTVWGALSKGSGSFKINHPLKPDTHYLVHSFIEGPQADNIYRGKVALVDGKAQVNIDQASRMTEGTFVALNRDVQCFTSNESDWDAVRGSVSGNILTIECQNQSSTATISWMVIGERQDQHMYDTEWTDEDGKVIVEPEKPPQKDFSGSGE
jgi:hypothetical protein